MGTPNRPFRLRVAALLAVASISSGGYAAPPDTTGAPKPAPAETYALPGEDPPKRFVPLNPRTVDDRRRIEAVTAFSVARALEDRRAWAEAIDLLDAALKLDPDSLTILKRLSSLCFILGRTEPGVEYSRKVLNVDPGDTETIGRLVDYYENRLKEPAGAEGVLKGVLENPRLGPHDPARVVALYEMGKLYAGNLHQPEKAADAYAKVIEALDDKAANKLTTADHRRILGDDEAAAYLDFGMLFQETKRYGLAAKAFERGLDYEPDDPQLPLRLAETLLNLNRAPEALTLVQQFLKRQPQGIDGYDLLAKTLTSLGRGGEITPSLEAAARVDSKNVALQYALADRYRETGQVERAEAIYKTLLEAQPTAQGFGALAASLLKRRKAEDLLKVIVNAYKRPGGMNAVDDPLKGIVDDTAFADQVLDVGLKLFSAEPPGLDTVGVQVLATIALRAGRLEKLLPLQRLALRRNPSPQGYKELIEVLARLRKYGEAAGVTEDLFRAYPDERNARQLDELSRYFRFADKPEDAVRAAREALALEPNDLEAQAQLALALSQTGKTDEAVALLKAAAEKEPNNPALGALLGNLLTQINRNEEAIAVLKGMLEKFPNNDEVVRIARQSLSIAYVNLGDYVKGEAELETLLERNPDEAVVNNDLGYLYAEQGKNLEKAEAMVRKALGEEPENSAYLDSLGWVLFKRGKAKEAVEHLEKAVQRLAEAAVGDATIHEHLGDVYFQLGEATKARASWTAAEKSAAKTHPPDKRLVEIRKKLDSLAKLGQVPKPSAGDTP